MSREFEDHGLTGISSSPSTRRLAGVAVVAFAAVTISLSFVLSRLAYDAGTNPISVILFRNLAFIGLVWLLYWWRGRSLRLPRRDLLVTYGAGAFYLLGTGGYLWSILYLPVSLAVLCFYTYPLMTVLFVGLLDRRLPGRLQLLAFVLAFVGLALALEVSFDALDGRGIAFALMGAVGASVAFIVVGRRLPHVEPITVTFHMSIISLVIVASAAAASGSFALPSDDGQAGSLLLAAAVLTFCLAFLAMFAGVPMIGSVGAAMVMNLEPVATLALAAAILGEVLGPQQFLGAGLVLAAIGLAQLPPATSR